jgi:hypothetical protein
MLIFCRGVTIVFLLAQEDFATNRSLNYSRLTLLKKFASSKGYENKFLCTSKNQIIK